MNIIYILALITSIFIIIESIEILIKPKKLNKKFKILKNQKIISNFFWISLFVVMILTINNMNISEIMVGILIGFLLLGGIFYSNKKMSKELGQIIKKVYTQIDWRILFILIVFALITIFSIIL